MTRTELIERPSVGERIKFDGERCRYTIQARSDRFVILTKPFNAQRTYLYTIVDLERGVRGACNLIFGLPCDVDTPEGALEALVKLELGDMAVSGRNYVDLQPDEIAALAAKPDQSAVDGLAADLRRLLIDYRQDPHNLRAFEIAALFEANEDHILTALSSNADAVRLRAENERLRSASHKLIDNLFSRYDDAITDDETERLLIEWQDASALQETGDEQR